MQIGTGGNLDADVSPDTAEKCVQSEIDRLLTAVKLLAFPPDAWKNLKLDPQPQMAAPFHGIKRDNYLPQWGGVPDIDRKIRDYYAADLRAEKAYKDQPASGRQPRPAPHLTLGGASEKEETAEALMRFAADVFQTHFPDEWTQAMSDLAKKIMEHIGQRG